MDPRFSFKLAAGCKNRRQLIIISYVIYWHDQGCVLSPMLYSLFTHDCLSCHVRTKILKFADDTTVIGLIKNSDESEYRDQVNKLISWCNDNNLERSVNKTKEMIVDFRRKKSSPPSPLVIDGRTVEIVQHFKCLGSTISSNLKWELNVVNIVKKGPAAAVRFKKVNIVWFDHTGHAQLLQSCNRECSDIFYHSMVWIDYTEGNAQIKQSCENYFPNHRQRPSQSRNTVSAASFRKSHSHISRFIPSCP